MIKEFALLCTVFHMFLFLIAFLLTKGFQIKFNTNVSM